MVTATIPARLFYRKWMRMEIPHHLLFRMKAPGDQRPVWRGGVLQIKITSACSLRCRNCSSGVGLIKKPFVMTLEQFRVSCRSLKGFKGVIGLFGGEPTLHPEFKAICQIFREEIPDKTQRGLWTNALNGHGKVCRETFHGPHSNLNVHGDREAWDEMKRDWPEGRVLADSLDPSSHGPLFGSPFDLGISEQEMWQKVSRCFINQTWSAEITIVAGQLVGFFCEIAATQAELLGDSSTGVPIIPGWWNKPITSFRDQVNAHCPRCLVPLNAKKINADGNDPELYTETWKPVMLSIKGRNLKQVMRREDVEGGGRATQYLPHGV